MNIIKVLAIVSLAYLAIACGGAEERKAAYLEKAEQSLMVGDLDKARIELKNVLQIDPKDARAYFQLGNVFDKKKEFVKAFRNYNKAAELDPEMNIKVAHDLTDEMENYLRNKLCIEATIHVDPGKKE